MLSIGEFSNICNVSPKTLRYYAEIGLLLPSEVNPENGYRYYSIEQLELMLFINRLKTYNFSLEEIKKILNETESQDELLYLSLTRKKRELTETLLKFQNTIAQLDNDLSNLKHGKSIMSYMDAIDIQIVEVAPIKILSIRKMVHKFDFTETYHCCFHALMKTIEANNLTNTAPPMVLFHSAEFNDCGLDTEFAIPVKESSVGTRIFRPDLCLKTTLYGSYSKLSSIYAKQREYAEQNGYISSNALYEVYLSDPSETQNEDEFITEIFYPIKKNKETTNE